MTVVNYRCNLSIIKKLIKLFYLHCTCKKVVETSNKENLKVIKNTLPNKSGNSENLKKIIRAVRKFVDKRAHSRRGFAEGILKVVFFTVLCFRWTVKKYCVAKFLKEFERDFYTKSTVTIIFTNLIINSLLSLFCPLLETKNKNQIFSKLMIW